ncbi:MAG: condensation domain-containing protein, partial [Methanobrevibacter sp.]|nr:condensation domain-containing protein [Candidatus Methanovirga meridionalis]
LITPFSFIATQLIIFICIVYDEAYITNPDKTTDIKYQIEHIKKHNIEISFYPPQLASVFLQYADGLLKTIAISADIASNIYSDKTILLNAYSATEAIAIATFIKINKLYKQTPIGKPLNGYKIYLVDDENNLIDEPNQIGEILIGGNISKGYYNNEELTKQKFIDNPFGEGKVFKSGDLAYYNENMDLVYYQRKDFMFNIRGQRVEPTQVEQAIEKIEGISKAVVKDFDVSSISNIENDKAIYAGIVLDSKKILIDKENNDLISFLNIVNDEPTINQSAISTELRKYLKDYMVPSVYNIISELPLTVRGKLDRKNALPSNILDLYAGMSKNKDIIKPANSLEKDLLEIFSQILNINKEKISITDNFFHIGGDSIKAIQFVNRIFIEYQIEIKLSDVYNSNIRILSKKIEKSSKDRYFKHESKEYYPLSPQQLTYFQDIEEEKKNSPHSISIFNVVHFLNLGNVDPVKLRLALLEAIEINHDMKIYFVKIDDEVYQKRCDELKLDIKINYDELTKDDIFNNFNLYKPPVFHNFNLYKPPLFHFEIYNYKKETALLISFNHIIIDGVSEENFLRDVLSIYSGKDVFKTEFDYFDYVLDLKESGKENNMRIKSYLEDKTKNSPLKSYFKSIQKKSESESTTIFFDVEIDKSLFDSFCMELKISFSNLFLGSIVLALGILFNNNNVYFEYIFNGRDKSKYNNVFGLFRRHFPFLFNINPKDSIKDYFKKLNKNTLDAFDIQPSHELEEFMKYMTTKNLPRVIYDYNDYSEIEVNGKKIEVVTPNLNNNMNKDYIFIRVTKSDNFILSILYDKAYFTDFEVKNLYGMINVALNLIINNPFENLEYILKQMKTGETNE